MMSSITTSGEKMFRKTVSAKRLREIRFTHLFPSKHSNPCYKPDTDGVYPVIFVVNRGSSRLPLFILGCLKIRHICDMFQKPRKPSFLEERAARIPLCNYFLCYWPWPCHFLCLLTRISNR